MRYRKYITAAGLTAALLLVNVFDTCAQFTPPDLPCDPEDTNCPLDTWVMVLVALTLITATLYLHKKQKAVN